MNSYYNDAVAQKKVDFDNIVLPELSRQGCDARALQDMFNAGQVRLRWGKDWKNFTIHSSNPHGEPTWIIDEQVHQLWNGIPVPNKLVMTCFLPAMGRGPLSSVAITDLYTLANAMKQFGYVCPVKNSHNNQSFITLPFNHRSLSPNLWCLGV